MLVVRTRTYGMQSVRGPLCFRRACTLSRARTPSGAAPAVVHGGRSRMTDYVPGSYRTDTYEHRDLVLSPAFTTRAPL